MIVPEANDPSKTHTAGQVPADTTLRILVVDDNRDSAETLSMLLELMGNEVTVAYDGEQALTIANEIKPDVVLLDIGLPKMNGYEVARQIRQEPWVSVRFSSLSPVGDRLKTKIFHASRVSIITS